MSDFDPGEGWRSIPMYEAVPKGEHLVLFDANDRARTRWVRQNPVENEEIPPYEDAPPELNWWDDRTLTGEHDE